MGHLPMPHIKKNDSSSPGLFTANNFSKGSRAGDHLPHVLWDFGWLGLLQVSCGHDHRFWVYECNGYVMSRRRHSRHSAHPPPRRWCSRYSAHPLPRRLHSRHSAHPPAWHPFCLLLFVILWALLGVLRTHHLAVFLAAVLQVGLYQSHTWLTPPLPEVGSHCCSQSSLLTVFPSLASQLSSLIGLNTLVKH